jgi:hypothetical protein
MERRRNPPEVDADEIIPRLWIGNWRVAQNADWLRANRIDTVFNCTKQVEFHPSIPRQYRVPVDDNLQPLEIKNMEEWAPEIAFKIYREYTAGSRILVHCHAGMQRSASAVAFFLLVFTGRPLIQIMYMIQSRRPITFRPTPNFAPALRGFEERVMTELLPNRPAIPQRLLT